MKNVGIILFDIDGVIRSVENSYRLSLKKTVSLFLLGISKKSTLEFIQNIII